MSAGLGSGGFQSEYMKYLQQWQVPPSKKPHGHQVVPPYQQHQHDASMRPYPPVDPPTQIRKCQCGVTLSVKVGVRSHCPRCKFVFDKGPSTQPRNSYPMGFQDPSTMPTVCEFCWKTGGRHAKNCPAKPEDPTLREMRLEKEELALDEEFGAAYIDADAHTFTDYEPARLKNLPGFREHPDPVTETSTLGSIMPPELHYKLRLPRQTISEGRLTSLQIESVLYACAQHEKFLPQQKVKAGFFMGDGPGVGKGRQIAGIVLENHVRGRKKALWISVSADLMDDAKRDLRDIGAGAIKVHDLKNYLVHVKLSKVDKMSSGVLFSTYTMLAREQKTKNGKKTRLEQILEWCGPDFDGVIAFDEAHKAKSIRIGSKPQQNMREGDKSRDSNDAESDVKGTKAAVAVIELQRLLPRARIVYVSATGASEPEHLLYASRLGLWGSGTSFTDSKQFAKDIKDGGTGAMELLAMQMKQNGQYLARSLSFKGASFEVVEESLDPELEATYNQAVELWADVLQAVVAGSKALEKKTRNDAVTKFWGANQHFWIQMCMAAKVKGVVRIAQQALDDGKCVVIGLQNTGEAGAEDDDSGCSTANSILKNYVEKWAPIDNDEKKSLIARSAKMQLPINPLDALIDAMGGPKRVAEMTGRKIRQICRRGEWQYVSRSKTAGSSDAINIQERKQFQSGKKLVAIISEAASIGISLQADRRVKNQRRRVHITLQLPWSADKAVQQMGRSHRSNQSSAPEFILVMSPIGGEWRFASQVAERLQTLGAITQGDRRATGSSGIQRFSIEPKYAAAALQTMTDAITKEKPTAELPEFVQEVYKGDFTLFTDKAYQGMTRAGMFTTNNLTTKVFMNRLLGIPIELQGQIFTFWHQLMEALIRDDKLAGKYQDGIVDIATELNTVLEETLLYTNPENGAETRYVRISGDRGISWERAVELHEGQTEELAGFYKKKGDNSKYNALLCLQKREQMATKRTRYFNVVRPNTGFRPEEIPRSQLLREYEKVDKEDMETEWKEIHKYSEHNCGHKQRRVSHACTGENCTFKKRTTIHNILIGNVLPHWHILKNNVGKKEKVKVVRVSTTCGKRYVGAIISGEHINAVKRDITAAKGLLANKPQPMLVDREVVPDEKEAGSESKKPKVNLVDLTTIDEEKATDDEEVLLSGGGNSSSKGCAVKEELATDKEGLVGANTEDVKPAGSDDGDETEDDGDEEEDEHGKTDEKADNGVADTSIVPKKRKPGKKKDKKDLLRKKAETVEISDDEAEVEQVEDDDAVMVTEKVQEKVTVLVTGDLAKSGLWEDDEDAKLLFADGLRACEEENEKYKEQNEEGEGDQTEEDDVACGSGTESEGEEDDAPNSKMKGAKGKGKAVMSDRVDKKKRAPRAIRKARQEATAIIADKAMKHDEEARKVRVDGNARQEFKDRCQTFMAGLLGRQELAGTMSESAVMKAIRSWVPEGKVGVGEVLRSSFAPKKELTAPKATLKRQIKDLHPSCVDRTLTSLSNKGINRVLAVLSFFAQGLVRQIFGQAVVRGVKTINRRWLKSEQGFEAIRDPALRHLLGLQELKEAPTESSSPRAIAPPIVRKSVKVETGESDDNAQSGISSEQTVDSPSISKDSDEKARNFEAKNGSEGVGEASTAKREVVVEPDDPGHVSDAGTESETDLDDEDEDENEVEGLNDSEDEPMEEQTDEESDVDTSPPPTTCRAKQSIPPTDTPPDCCKEGCKHGRSWSTDYFYTRCDGCQTWFHGDCVGVKEGAIPDDTNWVCCADCVDDIPLASRVKEVIIGKPKRKVPLKTASLESNSERKKSPGTKKPPSPPVKAKQPKAETTTRVEPKTAKCGNATKKPQKHSTIYCKKSCQFARKWDGEEEMIMCESCEMWFHTACVKVDITAIPEKSPWVCCHSCKYDLPISARRTAVVGSAIPGKDSGARVIDWKSNRVGVAKSKPDVTPAVDAKNESDGAKEAAAEDDDDSDDDIPLLSLPPKQTSGSSEATASAPTTNEHPLLRLVGPLAAFTGQERMTKKDAMAAVLNHVKEQNLFDRSDWDYVIPDERLQLLVGKKNRVKLRKLAKKAAQYVVDDSGAGSEPDTRMDDDAEDSPKSEKATLATPTSVVVANSEDPTPAKQPVKRLGFAEHSDSENDDVPLVAVVVSTSAPTTPAASTQSAVARSWFGQEVSGSGLTKSNSEVRGEMAVAVSVRVSSQVDRDELDCAQPSPGKRQRVNSDGQGAFASDYTSDAAGCEALCVQADQPHDGKPIEIEHLTDTTPSPSDGETTFKNVFVEDTPDVSDQTQVGRKRDLELCEGPSAGSSESPPPTKVPKIEQTDSLTKTTMNIESALENKQDTSNGQAKTAKTLEFVPDSEDDEDLDLEELEADEAAYLAKKRGETQSNKVDRGAAPPIEIVPDSEEDLDLDEEELQRAEDEALAERARRRAEMQASAS